MMKIAFVVGAIMLAVIAALELFLWYRLRYLADILRHELQIYADAQTTTTVTSTTTTLSPEELQTIQQLLRERKTQRRLDIQRLGEWLKRLPL